MRVPARYDLAFQENQRKLDAVDALGDIAGEPGCR